MLSQGYALSSARGTLRVGPTPEQRPLFLQHCCFFNMPHLAYSVRPYGILLYKGLFTMHALST